MKKAITASALIIRFFQTYAWECGVFLTTLLLVSASAIYLNALGLMRVLVDQNAHLNIARQMSDSLTPGVSQLGFWPPLLHVLMAPAAMNDFLFSSGFAGVAGIAPVAALGAVFLYRLAFLLTSNRVLSFASVSLMILNPYFLYYSATPMTESLFMSFLIITAYWVVRWMDSQALSHLVYAGIAASLASLARFEGLVLIPTIALIVAVTLYLQKTSRQKIEAALILFLFLALLGIVAILLNGWIYADNPLEFANGRWSAAAQQAGETITTRGSLTDSLAYASGASLFMLGLPLMALACAGFFLIAVCATEPLRLRLAALTAVVSAPMAFVIFALFRGDALIALPMLAPFEGFYNERYGLQGLGIVAVGILGGSAAVASRLGKFPATARIAPVAALSLILVATSVQAVFFSKTVFVDGLAVIRSTIPTSYIRYEEDAGRVLKEHYDGGTILITRGLNHAVGIVADIPLKNYIYESNVPHYENALEVPWLHARYVVIQNQNSPWREQNEFIARWKYSEEFNERYELLFENQASRVYKLRDNTTTSLALSLAL